MSREIINSDPYNIEPPKKKKHIVLRVIKWLVLITVVPFLLLIVSGMVYGIMMADSYEAVAAYADLKNNRDTDNIEAAYKAANDILKLSTDEEKLIEAKAYISQYAALQKKKQEEAARKMADETRRRFAYKRDKGSLAKKFKVTKDDYSGNKYYYHSSISRFNEIDAKDFYFYFGMPRNTDTPAALFLRVNYFGDHSLDMQNVDLLVDGDIRSIDFYPVRQKNLKSGVAEWAETDLITYDEEVLEKLGTAETVKMRLRGRDISDEIVLTKKQIAGLSETYRLFRAMGGQLSPRTVRTPGRNKEQDFIANNNSRHNEDDRIKRTRVRVYERPWWMGGGYVIREDKLNDRGFSGYRRL